MPLSAFVVANVSLSNAASPTVAGLNVGLIAAYHNVYPDRVRVYSTATALAQMVLDGFTVNSAAYKCAQAYCSASTTPSLLCIGRRALPPQQTLTLTCVDGTVGDSYSFTLVGSTGVSSAIAYTNVASVGGAGTGTVSVTNGSASITFSLAQTLTKGSLLVFSSQPGVYYALSANVTASTSGTLTAVYAGTTNAAASWTSVTTMTVTFNTVPGSATCVASATPVGQVKAGDSVVFASQVNTIYTVLSVSAVNIILTTPYTGAGSATDNATDVCTSSTAATAITALINAIVSVGATIGTVTAATNVITIARTDGNLTDVKGWAANGFASIQLADITVDPGIATDLSAMQSANTGAFYAVTLDSNSALEVAAAAAFIEATGTGGKVLFANNSDFANTVVATTTDVFSVTKTAAYKRSFIIQNDQQLLNYSGAAAASYALAQFPGSYTLAYKTLPGVPADSDTTLTSAQALALNTMTASVPGPGGKNGNYYKTVAGQNWLFPGCAPSGQFFDLTIGIDWLVVNLQADVAGVLSGLPKVPFTDTGLGLIGDAIRARLVLGSTPQYGLIVAPGDDVSRPLVVNVPKASALTAAQRASRNVSGFSFSAGLQGAIETATVTGTLSP
jgi:hypothetical protein